MYSKVYKQNFRQMSRAVRFNPILEKSFTNTMAQRDHYDKREVRRSKVNTRAGASF